MKDFKDKKQALINGIDDKIKNPLTVILFIAQDLIESYENNEKIDVKQIKDIVRQVKKIKNELNKLF